MFHCGLAKDMDNIDTLHNFESKKQKMFNKKKPSNTRKMVRGRILLNTWLSSPIQT